MHKVIYREAIRKRNPEIDVDYPPTMYVTKEANGYAVFTDSEEEGLHIEKYFVNGKREEAIRWCIAVLDQRRKQE